MLASVEEEANDDSFVPGISDISSVVVLIVGSVALLLTSCVALSIHSFGIKSASSKLVFMINRAQCLIILSKIPFLFNNIPYGCPISQVLMIYSFVHLLILSYLMLLCTNHLKLNLKSTVYSSTDLGLNKNFELFCYLFPLLFTILPISANAFEEKYNWCITNPAAHNGNWILVQAVLLIIVVIGLIGHRVWVIYNQANKYNNIIPAGKIWERILKGPFVYAIGTVSFSILGVILVRLNDIADDNGTQSDYYMSYAMLYIFFAPGYINFIIFFVEKRHLKVSAMLIYIMKR